MDTFEHAIKFIVSVNLNPVYTFTQQRNQLSRPDACSSRVGRTAWGRLSHNWLPCSTVSVERWFAKPPTWPIGYVSELPRLLLRSTEWALIVYCALNLNVWSARLAPIHLSTGINLNLAVQSYLLFIQGKTTSLLEHLEHAHPEISCFLAINIEEAS